MSDMTMQTAVVKACQLSSIIAVIAENNLIHVHQTNLIELANEMAGSLAADLMEKQYEENINKGGDNV
ncbi:hypothetical protein ABGY98_000496 [Salmonella enterica]|uniref:Uncharacterized protein n=1 Tax=Salmonella enterica subsp. diarizonae serovar 48:i:z TaxID=1192842 RepID=A0A7U6BC25_SALDZ|nr:hypothetical protein [Salmonella enterica]EAA4450262.1 hypothetical protein [Salmonella enterica subsp. diarizonae]EDW6116430.1 hypothetical protein [Salmonella enterica subsp. salamae]AXC70697.1 hypothetical protein DOE59_03130 [Salmonella enterica subsp. diarizonae serovar 48:i:z]EAM2672784.1 hypothetical protein [Salmonella enterica]EAM6405354.1 hypothetical protein [Salmonella enterica]